MEKCSHREVKVTYGMIKGLGYMQVFFISCFFGRETRHILNHYP